VKNSCYFAQSWRALLPARNLPHRKVVLHAAKCYPNRGVDYACNTGSPGHPGDGMFRDFARSLEAADLAAASQRGGQHCV
jgi:hypothetical protein